MINPIKENQRGLDPRIGPATACAHARTATGKSWAVITIELDDASTMRVSDPQGRLVRTVQIAAGQRLVELDLTGLAEGFYACELLQGEFKLGVTKLTVQR